MQHFLQMKGFLGLLYWSPPYCI